MTVAITDFIFGIFIFCIMAVGFALVVDGIRRVLRDMGDVYSKD